MNAKTIMMAAGAAALIASGATTQVEAGEHSRGATMQSFVAQIHAKANRARTVQQGHRNSAAISQDGSGNLARTIQRGNDNQAQIAQSGDNNRGRILQIGNGHSAALDQQGGERANVIQVNKGKASVHIETGQGRPRVQVTGDRGTR